MYIATLLSFGCAFLKDVTNTVTKNQNNKGHKYFLIYRLLLNP